MAESVNNVAYLTLLLLLFIFIFAVFGMQGEGSTGASLPSSTPLAVAVSFVWSNFARVGRIGGCARLPVICWCLPSNSRMFFLCVSSTVFPVFAVF